MHRLSKQTQSGRLIAPPQRPRNPGDQQAAEPLGRRAKAIPKLPDSL